MAITTSPLTITILGGLTQVYGLQYTYNVGLSNEATVNTYPDNNDGKTYTIPQTCGSGLYIGFYASDNSGNFLPNYPVNLVDNTSGKVRTVNTDNSGFAFFSFKTNCAFLDISYTLNFTIKGAEDLPDSPTIVVNVD